jgi:hypothetical protein
MKSRLGAVQLPTELQRRTAGTEYNNIFQACMIGVQMYFTFPTPCKLPGHLRTSSHSSRGMLTAASSSPHSWFDCLNTMML